MWGQGHHHVGCVYHPTQENLSGGIGAVPCIYLLEGQVFFFFRTVIVIHKLEHLVQWVEQSAPDVVPPMGRPLG